ncbi:MAG: hypothetical protein KAQ71_22025 [Desulfobulbaceae bacterium]|nr:hypothetical protein [Desulfobulbaceae bacterium]
MNSNTHTLTQERAELDAFLLGLLSNCLVRKTVNNCPLASIALKNIDEQLLFIEELSDSEIDRVVSYHQECFAKHTRKPGRR